MKTLLRMPGSAGALLPAGPAELECRELVKTFGGVRALRGVDLVIKPGKTLAVIGPDGAGKSCLINVLTGLYSPTSGKVTLNGEAISGKNLAARTRLGVMRTFQGTRIFSTLQVGHALALGARQ